MRKLGRKKLNDEHLNGAICLGEIRGPLTKDLPQEVTRGLLFRKGKRFFLVALADGGLSDFHEVSAVDIVRQGEAMKRVFKKIAGEYWIEEIDRGVFKEVAGDT